MKTILSFILLSSLMGCSYWDKKRLSSLPSPHSILEAVVLSESAIWVQNQGGGDKKSNFKLSARIQLEESEKEWNDTVSFQLSIKLTRDGKSSVLPFEFNNIHVFDPLASAKDSLNTRLLDPAGKGKRGIQFSRDSTSHLFKVEADILTDYNFYAGDIYDLSFTVRHGSPPLLEKSSAYRYVANHAWPWVAPTIGFALMAVVLLTTAR